MTTSVNNFLRIHSTTLECSVAYSNRKREKKSRLSNKRLCMTSMGNQKKKKENGKRNEKLG